jgi:hypothetical protein
MRPLRVLGYLELVAAAARDGLLAWVGVTFIGSAISTEHRRRLRGPGPGASS